MIDVIVNILMWVALGVCAAKWAVLSSKARMLRSALEDSREDNDYLLHEMELRNHELERALDDCSALEKGFDEMETGYQQEILSLEEEIERMESIQKSQSFELAELHEKHQHCLPDLKQMLDGE